MLDSLRRLRADQRKLTLTSDARSGVAGLLACVALLLNSGPAPADDSNLSQIAVEAGPNVTTSLVPTRETPLRFVENAFENASPLWYSIDSEGRIQIHLVYDHEYGAPNRATLHFHFRVHAVPGSELVFDINNLDNVWNGKNSMVSREMGAAMLSDDGENWRPVPLERLPDNRVRMKVKMNGPVLHVCRVDPYTLTDLNKFLDSIRGNPLVEITEIGETVEHRPLEIIRVGNPQAPYRVFLRARAHPWEAGGNWVVQGLIQRLLKGDDDAKKYLERYCVYVMPMANKDGVARGRSRFNMLGKDLNRGWNDPADPELAPENVALERWLEDKIANGQKPHLAIEVHNDGNGKLHISRPDVPNLTQHLERMKTLEQLLRMHTWFTEGSTPPTFSNSGTLGQGWLLRYGIDGVVHELNCNWIAGLNEFPSRESWQNYGGDMAKVLYEYFGIVKP